MSERIEQVAIKHAGQIHTAQPPRRHHHVIAEMAKRGYGPECMHNQGFVTDKGRFVDRWEARRIATLAGQIGETKKTNPQNELFSEDLW